MSSESVVKKTYYILCGCTDQIILGHLSTKQWQKDMIFDNLTMVQVLLNLLSNTTFYLSVKLRRRRRNDCDFSKERISGGFN